RYGKMMAYQFPVGAQGEIGLGEDGVSFVLGAHHSNELALAKQPIVRDDSPDVFNVNSNDYQIMLITGSKLLEDQILLVRAGAIQSQVIDLHLGDHGLQQIRV